MFGVEYVLYVTQNKRCLAHAALPQQHQLEIVRGRILPAAIWHFTHLLQSLADQMDTIWVANYMLVAMTHR